MVIDVYLSCEPPIGGLQDMEKYQIIREIGNGSFAKVLLARCKLTYRVFAIKKMVK